MIVGNASIVEGPLDGSGLTPDSYDVIVLEGAVDHFKNGAHFVSPNAKLSGGGSRAFD